MFVASSFDMAAKRPVPLAPVDESLWYPTVPASVVANTEPTTVGVNLGVIFTVSLAGDLHSICYYRVDDAMASSGTVALWQISDSTDVLLGQVDYSGHSGVGWKVVPLTTPFRLSPAEAYLAHVWVPSTGSSAIEPLTTSYFANVGHYSSPWQMLYATVSNGQFDPRGFIRRNGFITVGAFARPSGIVNSDNYWVDVIYNARPLPEPPDAPMLLKWPIPAGWPTAETTGPAPDTVFSPPDFDPVDSTADGQIIEARDLRNSLSIKHNNVTVRHCKIRNRIINGIYIYADTTGTLIQDCSIDGVGRKNAPMDGIRIGGTEVTIERCNIFRIENGTSCFGHPFPNNLIIRDCFIHHLRSGPGSPHYDGVEFDGGQSAVEITHNTIMNENVDTACVQINSELGATDDILVQDNVLFGGGYTVYNIEKIHELPDYPITNVRYLRNLMRSGREGYFIIDTDELPVRQGNQFLDHGSIFDAPPPGGFTAGQVVPESLFGYARDTTASIIGEIVDDVIGGITLGVGFRPLQDGQISGVNFRRPAFTSTLLVTVAVWRFLGSDLAGGVELLGSQDYTNVIPTGLRNFTLDTPIDVVAGDNLAVGVFIPRGSDGKLWYFSRAGAFWPDPVSSQWARMTAFSNNPATQLPGFTGGNGMFHYGPALAAPVTASSFDADYAVDPVFVAAW